MARQSLSPMVGLDDDNSMDEMANNPAFRRRGNQITHLRYLRKKNGYTLDGLSRATSISVSYLSRLESGSRRLNTDLIKRLAKAFNCEPAELLQEGDHDGRSISPIEFSKRKKAESFSRENTMPLYFIGRDENDENKLTITIASVNEWKNRPSELVGRDRAFALRADEYFMPYFEKTSTLYLEPAGTLVPEATVVLLSCGEITIKKVWSVTPNSLQLCDMLDIEKMKKGEVDVNDKIINVTHSDIDFIYKVVGFSDFKLA